jgi:hypothetical protein
MARAVELARLAERVQLLGRPLDTAFSRRPETPHAGQARSHGVEDVIGQVLGLGQEHHRAVELALRDIHAKMAALGKARIQGRLVAGMPAPAVSGRQATEQVVGGQTGQQHRTLNNSA